MRLPRSPEGSTAAQPKRGLKETSRKLVKNRLENG